MRYFRGYFRGVLRCFGRKKAFYRWQDLNLRSLPSKGNENSQLLHICKCSVLTVSKPGELFETYFNTSHITINKPNAICMAHAAEISIHLKLKHAFPPPPYILQTLVNQGFFLFSFPSDSLNSIQLHGIRPQLVPRGTGMNS